MKCLDCTHCDLRTHPKHSNVGFGRCRQEKSSGVFESITSERNCNQFQHAAEEKIIKRIAWWDQIKMFR